jgi:hypothetical protein
VNHRFRDQGRLAPEGLKYVASCFAVAAAELWELGGTISGGGPARLGGGGALSSCREAAIITLGVACA